MLNKFLRSNAVYYLLIVVLTIPLCIDFFKPQLINGHDAMAGLIRALSMSKYMGHGQFLVRWSPEINMGYGYPMFNFYPPLFSFLSVMVFQLTHNMALAINWSCILFWVLSGIGMFVFAREFWGDEGGMLCAVLYIYVPYHIIDLYIRGAFAEFTSFAFFPFLLYVLFKLSQEIKMRFFILGIACVFGLSLAHNIMSMLFFPVAVAFTLYLYIFENRSGWIWAGISVFVIGLMMSSFFWLPALLEKEYLNLNFLIGHHYDFHQNFASMSKLFWPFNKWGMDHISFEVGFIHSLLCLLAMFLISRIFKISRQAGRMYLFILCIGVLAIFFTLPCSHFWWEHISLLDYVQFPWRFLTIIVFCMSFLSGSILMLIQRRPYKIAVLIALSLASIIIYPKLVLKPDFIDHTQNVEDFIALGDGEYTPKWVTVPPDKRPVRKFEIIQGNASLGEESSLNPVHYQTILQSLYPSLVCFHTFYFPGWKVNIDGQSTDPHLDNPFGLILFTVPPGNHHIEVYFSSTPLRIISVCLSWIGFILFILGVIWIRRYQA